MNNKHDLIVIGSGAAGMMAAIVAARNNKKVLLLEKLSNIASKLKATGGGRCNLTNTLSNEEFMARFGRDGRFMQDALGAFDSKALVNFFSEIGVETHAPDGFRIFPTSHSSSTIISALQEEMQKLGIDLKTSQKVEKILVENGEITGVKTENDSFYAPNVIVATGGLGYPTLGAEGDGYTMASELGHKVTELHPAMMPLKTKESWVANCRADTIAKVELRVDLPKHKKLRATGDLIFTNSGIRGPVVLDFAREVTPLLEKYGEVPLLLNLTKGMNEEQISKHIKEEHAKNPHAEIVELIATLLPHAISEELCHIAGVNPHAKNREIEGAQKAKLIQLLAWTPLTVTGHDGFKMAMITRGGINLKEIEPKTMQSRLVKGLYFCGEVMNLDGPCGGYNLQWSFASGALAGELKH
ncbi:MAG: NAD(P)/FAD-dependent oxidoreductase [Epsilonproteobacteria bacterium]|nr:NAD(P)/FAD-dependent oxidoreductase [Campylobacterota bacterium]PIP09502.1 MAG: aminoacetone oxidase family FAD-binding enzyme [Sulfurimonas sp. CG23_combo_of_CG06-09_8_20_14_all_36_33]PIS23718.1 MAG: NAD(P)/FAD-dependent oxidoreductase [Sulfurimonas sp. CG08_land_8_20_14_0_20_36_33]PIU35692.1 MAG: NAD(P)/FAD-dependent oxidoreductase [Sulfurimonas sp. CG07_land_8_20_14_0_80_36_56]PIV05001.1 MAG: NAD(P)/FAD-dependent oxidoreductase [Sulfurimonas sp. CG03_land_8_20_14_0_80_36_25]PIV36312.1 MA